MLKPKSKKKPMTLEDFAVVIQEDIARMATKDDLWPIQRDLKTVASQLGDLRSDVKQITDVMVSKADLANTLGDELAKSVYGRQIDDLRNRVNILEEKLGIKSTHRAA
jgi:hypothetical protein